MVMAFILWGASSVLVSQNKSTSYAGEIFGEKVSYKEYNDISKMLYLFTDKTASSGSDDTDIWLYLILKHEARKRKIPVVDEEVMEQIKKMFGGLPSLDPQRYEQWVRNVMRESPRSFEEIVREFIRIQKLMHQSLLTPAENETPGSDSAEERHDQPEKPRKDSAEKTDGPDQEKTASRFKLWAAGLIEQARVKKYQS
jgi:hypothetical protein